VTGMDEERNGLASTPKHRPEIIAIYLSTLFNGGVERVMFNLATSFLERGIEVDIVLDKLSYSPFKEHLPPGANLVVLGAHSIVQRIPRLCGYLRRRRPTAMLSANHFANELAIIARGMAGVNTKIIVSEHTSLSTELARLSWKSPRRLIPRIMRAAYRRADAVVAVSKGVAGDVVNLTHLRDGSVTVIYNPIDFAMVRREALTPVDHPWFLPGAPDVILAIGRLEEQKNFGLLLDAFALVRQQREVRLLILGEGSQRSQLEARILDMGLADTVQLPGFLANPFAYLDRARVLAMSSLWEGFGLVLIEALSLKTPVVATDCPSGPDEALSGGAYGELVPMNDPPALARALMKVLGGDAKSAPDEWLRQFEPGYVADKYLALLS